MNVLDRTLPWLPRIDLSREPEFSLGELRVRPSRREVEAGELRLALQPRVMQVLVALAHPSSDVVSQDELISRCWGGLTVGEDAVARCISQLRRAAASWPEPPFQIETIPGVGDCVAGRNEIVPRSSGLPSSVTLPETASLGRSSTRAGPQALKASAPLQPAITATKSRAGLQG